MVKTTLVVLLVAGLLVTVVVVSEAQILPGFESAPRGFDVTPAFISVPGFYVDPSIRKFINSFASYQFPDPNTGTDPASRLEFPIDNWFIGIQFRRIFTTMSFNLEFCTRLNQTTGLKMQDSDWDQFGKTTFSESEQRLAEGYLLDINADFAAVSWFGGDLRPVLGFRWQTFRFIAGDGFQFSLDAKEIGPLAGDSFDVRFTFQHYYVGARSHLNLGRLGVSLQGDYGWLTAKDADRHLLRGDRITTDTGKGYCWHLSASASMLVKDCMSVRLEGDFKRLVAKNCSHWWDEGDGIEGGSWDGAKIWSDQQSVSAYAEFRF
jgi:hypothetical protein